MEGQRREKDGKRGREEEKERIVYGIIQGRTFTNIYLGSFALQLFNLNSLATWSLLERSKCGPLHQRALPSVHFSYLWLQHVSLPAPEATLGVHIATPSSEIDDFFPVLRIIVNTALGSHQSWPVRWSKDTTAGFAPCWGITIPGILAPLWAAVIAFIYYTCWGGGSWVSLNIWLK